MNHLIDQVLLTKYDVSGPRYTSYPTARQFHSQFGEGDYRWHIEHSNQDPVPKPLSLYLHIPFCKALCYYCGCHKIITQNRSKILTYLDALHKEIKNQASLFDPDREVRQVHLGGGTPTYLYTAEIQQLLNTIKQYFKLAPMPDCEMGIEIDPRTTDKVDIEVLANMGFNRMSFGVQDFDRQVQVAINRLQDKDQTLELLYTARSAGVASLSVDLIYGLPKQTQQSFVETLKAIIAAHPDRIALYNYAHMPSIIKAQKMIQENDLPEAEAKLELLNLSIDTLTAAGYCHIGMDHFALPSDPLSRSLDKGELHRNFQGYSTHGDCDIIGFGASAISRVGDAFSQNHKNLLDYQRCIKNQRLATQRGYSLSADDRIRAAVIQHIMCSHILNFKDFGRAHHIIFKQYFQRELEQLKPMSDDQLLIITEDKLQITARGRLLLRNIAMIFDAYLPQNNSADNCIQFSKVL